jgi:hypothetical protein
MTEDIEEVEKYITAEKASSYTSTIIATLLDRTALKKSPIFS